jgi:hypothetical protein
MVLSVSQWQAAGLDPRRRNGFVETGELRDGELVMERRV